jgi:neutral/alkaline ceramidase-like enzyme
MLHVDTPQSYCQFGSARCDITPPVGIYHRMWGAATHERATGVHRPLTATALVFRAVDQPASPATEVILLALDHCLLWAGEMTEFLQTVARKTGVAEEQLLVSFSHTHAAGLMDKSRLHLPGGDLIPPYLAQLANRCADIVQQARGSLQRATIAYATGHCPLAAERDFYDTESKQYVCGFNPQGSSDDTILVANITGSDRQILATLVNYACHPTTLAWENTLISPDFPGAMREVVEQATGAPCAFLQGASGDLGPREGFVGDPAIADRNGRQLGYAVLSALEALPPPETTFQYTGPVVSGATLGSWAHVPLDSATLKRHAGWRLKHWTLPLPYRADLPTLEQTQTERTHWLAEEKAAQAAGDEAKARDCHAMVERQDRQLVRLNVLPPGKDFPLPIALWRMGDAFWLAVEAEHYQVLQRQLRARFPAVPIMVLTIVNGSRAAYLPPADAYGKGIYQESIALLAAGSLEKLIEAAGNEIAQWM